MNCLIFGDVELDYSSLMLRQVRVPSPENREAQYNQLAAVWRQRIEDAMRLKP